MENNFEDSVSLNTEVSETPSGRPNSAPDVNTAASAVSERKKSVKPIVLTLTAVFVCSLCLTVGILLGNGILSPLNTIGNMSSSAGDGTAAATSSGSEENSYVFTTQSSGESFSVAEVAARTMDSVVEIKTETVTTGGFMQQYVTEGAGSGVIIREDGLVVTNHHVIDGASTITVRLRSGIEYTAILLGTDSATDIALLKIEAEGLPVAVLGDSSSLVVGAPVIAIGNPLGSLGGTVTDGIISALERQISIDGQSMTLLQTNAAINPGNSGGGLFNAAGELIGIVNAKSSGSGIEGLGFAIPINTAKPVFEDLLNYGYVRGRMNFGATLLDIYTDSEVRNYGVPSQGTYISELLSGSDADRAGLKTADRIKSVNGIDITSSSTVSEVLNGCEIGDTLNVTIVRVVSSSFFGYRTEEYTFEVVLTEYAPAN